MGLCLEKKNTYIRLSFHGKVYFNSEKNKYPGHKSLFYLSGLLENTGRNMRQN